MSTEVVCSLPTSVTAQDSLRNICKNPYPPVREWLWVSPASFRVRINSGGDGPSSYFTHTYSEVCTRWTEHRVCKMWSPSPAPAKWASRKGILCRSSFFFLCWHLVPVAELFNPTGIVPALSFWVSAVGQHQIKRVQTLRNLEQAWVSSLYLCNGDNTWEDSFLLGSVGGFHELGQVEVPWSWQIAVQSKMVLI